MPIHLAASKGYCDIIVLLARHGSLLHVIDCEGTAPLHQAVQHGHVKAAEALIACGASATASMLVRNLPCHRIEDLRILMLQQNDVHNEAGNASHHHNVLIRSA